MSLEVATWVTAVATVVLAFGAYATTVLAVRAFKQQGKEVSDQATMLGVQSQQLEEQRKINAEQTMVLQLQATELRESLEERKREARERRRAQASRVFIEETRHAYISDPSVITGGAAWVRVTVRNSGSDPIYSVQLRWHQGSTPHGDPNPEPLGIVMPGAEASSTREFARNANLDVCGAVLEFRDAAGVQWMRRPDGDLSEQE